MAGISKPSLDPFDHPRGQPICLTSVGGRATGAIQIQNPGDDDLRVNEVQVEYKVPGSDKAASRHRVLTSSTLSPGNSTQLRLGFTMDPAIAPGTLEGTISIGGMSRPLQVHVARKATLVVQPSKVVIYDDELGQGVEMVATNNGNVPIRIPSSMAVGLESEHIFCRTLRALLGRLSESAEESHDVNWFADETAKQAALLIKQSGFLRVRVDGADTPLKPGEARLLKLTFAIQDACRDVLPAIAELRLGSATVAVRILSGDSSEPQPKKKRVEK